VNSNVYSKLALRLSTMAGYPGWSDVMSENYFLDLAHIPDDIGQRMVQEVGHRFDERPSAKNLLDWARSLGPQKPFDIRQLDAGAHREGGPCRPGASALAALTGEGKSGDGKTPMPTSAKAVIEALRQKEQARYRGNSAALPTGDYGLEYFYPDGKTERFPARHSEAEAQARRAEVCRKYSHFTCRVYRKSV